MKFQSVKGMDDHFGVEVQKWQVLEQKSRAFFEAHGFREIRTPILENTDLFARSIGEASDIVHKEMYTFSDRAGRSLTLRPEMTAGVIRAVLEHNLLKPDEPLFVYYFGPQFRAERPQAGRKREFHQIGVETLNTHSAVNDAELLIMVKHYLDWLGLKQYAVKLNHLGSGEDRLAFSCKISEYFNQVRDRLCEDCRFRLSRNVLRVLDCKNASCQRFIQKAPKPLLGPEARSNFEQIQSLLKDAGVPFSVDHRLVRGIDYYTDCVFEITAQGLGAQDAILAGGRYNHLIRDLGGPEAGASGFSIGVERLLLALDAARVVLESEALANTVYVAALRGKQSSCDLYRKIALALTEANKRAYFSFASGSVKNHLKRANKMNVGYVLIVGDDELRDGEVSLKNMATGTQKRLKPDQIQAAFGGV